MSDLKSLESLASDLKDSPLVKDADTQHFENKTKYFELTISELKEEVPKELSQLERNCLKDILGWSDDQLDRCTVGEDGTIKYKTINCVMEGKVNEHGVPFERKTVEIHGVKIEVVVPKFNSVFEATLPEDDYKKTDVEHKKECNRQLKDVIQKDPKISEKFNPEQLEQIKNGKTPDGYIWHHKENPGELELVSSRDHKSTGHTGGRDMWGGRTESRK